MQKSSRWTQVNVMEVDSFNIFVTLSIHMQMHIYKHPPVHVGTGINYYIRQIYSLNFLSIIFYLI